MRSGVCWIELTELIAKSVSYLILTQLVDNFVKLVISELLDDSC